jgi:hypothetical protein
MLPQSKTENLSEKMNLPTPDFSPCGFSIITRSFTLPILPKYYKMIFQKTNKQGKRKTR